MSNETIKTIKGFDGDLKCRDMQYEVGKEYDLPDGQEPRMCESGFHAISPDKSPLSVFDFYPPSINGKPSRYCEVEVSGKTDKIGDKVVGSHIKIGAEIGIKGLIKAHVEWVKSHITNEHNAEPGKPATAGDSGSATAGDRGSATAGYSGSATAGDRGLATAGDSGSATAGHRGLATAGSYGSATAGSYGSATAGDRGSATAGYRGSATAGDSGSATAGDRGSATAGYRGSATAGDRGSATSRGSSAVGKNGLAVARGNGVKVKGDLGTILVIAEENDDNYDIKGWKAVVVDGETIKADTWYKLVDGELKEVED